jgi:hypothetical protein
MQNGNLTISEVNIKQKELATHIRTLILEFESQTSCIVVDIDIPRYNVHHSGERTSLLGKVTIDARFNYNV